MTAPGLGVACVAQRENHATVESMMTLSEIEAAADALPADQKEELLLFLASRLRAEKTLTATPRRFSREQLEQWVREDEAGYRRFLERT